MSLRYIVLYCPRECPQDIVVPSYLTWLSNGRTGKAYGRTGIPIVRDQPHLFPNNVSGKLL